MTGGKQDEDGLKKKRERVTLPNNGTALYSAITWV